jgi:hypothetical protein
VSEWVSESPGISLSLSSKYNSHHSDPAFSLFIIFYF